MIVDKIIEAISFAEKNAKSHADLVPEDQSSLILAMYCSALLQQIEKFKEEEKDVTLEQASSKYLDTVEMTETGCGDYEGWQLSDAFEAGAKWKEQQMLDGAFVYEKKHDTACVLASECLREHGWFAREKEFNDLWKYICGVDKLFNGEFDANDKVKLIAIKQEKQ